VRIKNRKEKWKIKASWNLEPLRTNTVGVFKVTRHQGQWDELSNAVNIVELEIISKAS